MSTRRVDSSASTPRIRMPQLRATAGADQQRGRRGQAERARAGDDQHGDGGGERGGRAPPVPSQKPSVPSGQRDHHRHEDGGDPVGQPLHGGLAVLRLLDQPGHLGQLGVGADPGGADEQAAAGVHGRAGHRVARRAPRPAPTRRSAGWRRAPRRRRSTTPSVATFSPGRTRKMSPTRRSAAGIARSAPSRVTTVTVLAPSSSSARSASPGAALRPRLEIAPGQQERGHAGGRLEIDRRRRRGRSARTGGSSRAGRRRRGTAPTATSRTRPACRARPGCPWWPRRAAG